MNVTSMLTCKNKTEGRVGWNLLKAIRNTSTVKGANAFPAKKVLRRTRPTKSLIIEVSNINRNKQHLQLVCSRKSREEKLLHAIDNGLSFDKLRIKTLAHIMYKYNSGHWDQHRETTLCFKVECNLQAMGAMWWLIYLYYADNG